VVQVSFLVRGLLTSLIVTLFACLSPAFGDPPRDKSVWNYDGGIVMMTDGSIPDGPCFRLAGRVSAPGFFDNLKRVDTSEGATFRRGSNTLSTFPDHLLLTFRVYDHPCSIKLQHTSAQEYLTHNVMRGLQLSLYWKRGVELRPVNNVELKYFAVDPVTTRPVDPHATSPEKFVWYYEFVLPGGGVPLTDSLVLVLREPNGHIAARVAARM
jgi:hypothetical protein